MTSQVNNVEQETAGIQSTLVSDSTERRPSLDMNDGIDGITETLSRKNSMEINELHNTNGTSDFGTNVDMNSASDSNGGDRELRDTNNGQTASDDTVEENQYHVALNNNNEVQTILDQPVGVVGEAIDVLNRPDTTPTLPNAPPLSTTPGLHLEHDSQQNDTQQSISYLNDTTNQLLRPSTSATTTTTISTTGTQTDTYDYDMDQHPRIDSLIDDNDYTNQRQPNDTPPQSPQIDNNCNNTMLPVAYAIPTTSSHINFDNQPLNRTATAGSDEQTLSEPPGPRHEWESDRQASECRRCGRRFNFLIRRHHCRRCGQIVCDRCSSHRVRLPVEEIVEDPLISTSHYPIIALNPQRVCEACIRIPIKADSTTSAQYSTRNINNNRSSNSNSANGSYHQQPSSMNMQRSNSQQSLMVECPVCGNGLLGMRKEQQEYHLNQCLNTGSSTLCPPRYIIYTLMAGAAQVGDECPICFDEFQVGNKIARMVCLCSYHRRCLRTWLERGKGCPIHFDSNFGAY